MRCETFTLCPVTEACDESGVRKTPRQVTLGEPFSATDTIEDGPRSTCRVHRLGQGGGLRGECVIFRDCYTIGEGGHRIFKKALHSGDTLFFGVGEFVSKF